MLAKPSGCLPACLISLSMAPLPLFPRPITLVSLSLPRGTGHAMFSACVFPHSFPWPLAPYRSGLSSNVINKDRLTLSIHPPHAQLLFPLWFLPSAQHQLK